MYDWKQCFSELILSFIAVAFVTYITNGKLVPG
nr:MAG TPA: hypothetical protein [Bacteriophage sp.]